MSWLWGSWGGQGTPKEDPTKKLDPSLKDFLAEEARHHSAAHTPNTATPYQSPVKRTEPANTSSEDDSPKVPPQSLYQDGRYAHLWKNYKPLSQTEAEAKTDQERIQDLYADFKHRRAAVNRAALENCMFEEAALDECYRNGSWSELMTGCKKKNRDVAKCFKTNVSFLKALGYLARQNSTPEEDEIIQMHADKLYQRLLEQEAIIDKARAEGKPVPKLEPLQSDRGSWKSGDPEPRLEDYLKKGEITKAIREEFTARMKNTEEPLRSLEAEGFIAELRAGHKLLENLGSEFSRQDAERNQRVQEGQGSITDKVTDLLWGRK